MSEPDYSQEYAPKAIDFWLRHWRLLDALVTSPRTAEHHLTRFHEKYASNMQEGHCCQEPAPGSGWRLSLSYAETRADLDTAASRLTPNRLQICQLIARGHSLNEVVKCVARNKGRVLEEYRLALIDMAHSLGWQEKRPQLVPVA